MQNDLIATDRPHECDGCIGCCDGTLTHEYVTQSGKQLRANNEQICDNCGPSGVGCLDYEDRPDGCDEFQCVWTQDQGLPLWLNPKHCGFMILGYPKTGENYLTIKEVKSYKLNYESLLWVLHWANEQRLNILTVLKTNGVHYYENER